MPRYPDKIGMINDFVGGRTPAMTDRTLIFREPIYRTIHAVLAADIVIGIAIMAGADDWWPRIPGLAMLGAALAAIGAGLLLLFRHLARREERRREL
jgi:hypothetical protein